MNWSRLVRLARRLPEVEEGTWYGTPGRKVAGKGFVRLKEDGETVVFLVEHVGVRDALLASKPEVYFLTDHYRRSAAVLARLDALDDGPAGARLEEAWRAKAPKRLVRQIGD